MMEEYTRSPNERICKAALEALATFRKGPFPFERGEFEKDDFDEKDLGF
jgi:hypothetical protein